MITKKLYSKSSEDIFRNPFDPINYASRNLYTFNFKDTDIPLISLIESIKPITILDYGCGQGNAVKQYSALYPHIDIQGYDPFYSEYEKYPESQYDLIVSYNAINNIEDEYFDEAIEDLQRMCNKILLVSLIIESHRTYEWYKEKFRNFKMVYEKVTTLTPPSKVGYYVLGTREDTVSQYQFLSVIKPSV
jgi:hypothetical protein